MRRDADGIRGDTAGFAWSDAKRIFLEVIEKPREQRLEYAVELCGEDSDLYREVMSLLQNYDGANSFLETPPAGPIAARLDLMVGRRIGAYHILRQIGEGGMGAVYLAERADDQFRKLVALKAVRTALAGESALRRFQNERQTLAVLDHSNIIKLLDAGTTEDGIPYLVTEYIEGQPIDRYCTSAGLSLRKRLELFRALLSAVHYAHQHLIVHRDLKPGNILVTPSGVPKLLDFGIAKLLQPEFSGHAMGLTHSNMQPMTPNYASPEQILGQPITTASDIYSLGVVLYQLLAGRHPFEQQMRTAFELGQAICETTPEKPSKFANRSELRGDLDTIVLKAVRKEPLQRYASVEHFSEDIRRYLEGFPVLARNAGMWHRAAKFVGRHRATAAGVAFLSAALIVSSVEAIEQQRAAARRFAALRHFANFVLNDLDASLRQGTTPARAVLAEKGVQYLDELALEKGNDPAIKRDLVNGYLKNGDAKGNLYGASLGETAGAEDSYRKGLGYAEELVRADASNIEDRLNLVRAHVKLGEVQASSGNRPEAMKHFDEAARIHQKTMSLAAPDTQTLIEAANLWASIGSLKSLSSDPGGAMESYRYGLATAERLPASFPKKAGVVSFMKEHLAECMVLSGGDSSGAEDMIRESIATYRRAIDLKPTAGLRRSLARANETLAEIQSQAGRNEEALATSRQSLAIFEALLSEDPDDEHKRIDRQQALIKEIEMLIANHRDAEAKQETKRALQLMKPLAEQSSLYQYAEDYAQLLATTPFADLRDDAAALRYAHKAVTLTHETDPDVLHALAQAYERNGDKVRAIEINRKALSMLPSGATSVFRTTLESEVRRISDQNHAE